MTRFLPQDTRGGSIPSWRWGRCRTTYSRGDCRSGSLLSGLTLTMTSNGRKCVLNAVGCKPVWSSVSLSITSCKETRPNKNLHSDEKITQARQNGSRNHQRHRSLFLFLKMTHHDRDSCPSTRTFKLISECELAFCLHFVKGPYFSFRRWSDRFAFTLTLSVPRISPESPAGFNVVTLCIWGRHCSHCCHSIQQVNQTRRNDWDQSRVNV